jgi:hypothetical protein
MQPVQSKHSPAETTVWDGPRQEYPSLPPPDLPDQMEPPESWSSDRANAPSSKQQTVVLMICVCFWWPGRRCCLLRCQSYDIWRDVRPTSEVDEEELPPSLRFPNVYHISLNALFGLHPKRHPFPYIVQCTTCDQSSIGLWSKVVH